MMKLNNQLLNIWMRKLEFVVTVFWLLYFMNVTVPSPMPRLIRVLSYGIIFILVILHWKRLSWVATRDIFLLLLLGIAFASFAWSSDPGKTLDSFRALFRMFLFGAYFTTRYSLKEQMKIFAWVFSIAGILSIVVAVAIPRYGMSLAHSGAWEGIFAHKNILGYAMALGAILFLLTAIKDRRPNWLAWWGFILAVVLTFLSHSSSALMSLLLLLSLMPIYKLVKQHYKLRVIFLCIALIVAGSSILLIFGNLETILVNILKEGMTLNGRTGIWDLIIEKTWEQPWLGYGYNAFWESDAGKYVAVNTWAGVDKAVDESFNAHSGYFEFLPQLGFLGMSIYAISLVTVFVRVFILLLLTKKIEFFWFFQFLVFLCVANIGDMFVSILGPTYSYTSIYVSICLSTSVEFSRISKKRYFNKLSIT